MESAAPTTKVTITYCTQCNWLLRAQWMAGELLQTFAAEVGEIALRPGTGGIFRIEASGPGVATARPGAASEAGDVDAPTVSEGAQLVWDRKADGGFPGIVDLKRRVRDVIAPELVLGHADRAAASQDS